MHFNVIGIGQVLWDLLPSGAQLGGAPANFAFHAQALGGQAQVITRVGNDAHGREILRRLQWACCTTRASKQRMPLRRK